jgi:hypothetical protein
MVTPVPFPLMDAPRFPVCEPLDHPVKELSSNPAPGMVVADTDVEKPKIERSKKNTDGTAIITAGLLTRRRRTNMEPPSKSLQFYHLLVANN